MKQIKVTTAAEAVASIQNGNSVLIFRDFEPMCIIQELLKQGKRNLSIISYGASKSSEILYMDQRVSDITTNAWNRELKAVKLLPEAIIYKQLLAGVDGDPFAVMCLSEELRESYPDLFFEIESHNGIHTVAVVAAQCPDVAILHAPRADIYGNIQLDPVDDMRQISVLRLALSAKRRIVSVEQIVSEEAIHMNPNNTVFTGDQVDYVIEAPYGSYPCKCGSRYSEVQLENTKLLSDMKDSADWYERLGKIGFGKLMEMTSNRRGE